MPVQYMPLNTRTLAVKWLGDTRLKAVAAVLLASVLVLVCAARAAEPEPLSTTQPILFDIPEQPLAAALHAFGRRVGVQVLYDSQSAVGRRSIAIQGELTPDDALRRLLGNTDLEVRHASADAISLVATTTSPPPFEQDLPPPEVLSDTDLSLGELRVRASVRPTDLNRFADYSEVVRTEIQRALLKNPRSATGNYRVVLDLWIEPSRAIRKATLLQPTGDDARDNAITTTLQGLIISRPTPADAPQPIRAVVAVSTSK